MLEIFGGSCFPVAGRAWQVGRHRHRAVGDLCGDSVLFCFSEASALQRGTKTFPSTGGGATCGMIRRGAGKRESCWSQTS